MNLVVIPCAVPVAALADSVLSLAPHLAARGGHDWGSLGDAGWVREARAALRDSLQLVCHCGQAKHCNFPPTSPHPNF